MIGSKDSNFPYIKVRDWFGNCEIDWNFGSISVTKSQSMGKWLVWQLENAKKCELQDMLAIKARKCATP